MKISKEDVKAMGEELQQVSLDSIQATDLNTDSDSSVPILRNAAQEYLFVLESLNLQLQNFSALLKRQKALRHGSKDYGAIDEYIRNKEQVRLFLISDIPLKLYEATFKFQAILNEVLGQKVKMVFVFDNGTGPELYEITNEKILQFDYSSNNKLVARYNATQTSLNDSLKKLELDKDLKFDLDNLKSTYLEVLERYRYAKSRGSKRVMWQYPSRNWKIMKVSAEGDINEAYAFFVIMNQPTPAFRSGLEKNINDFMIEGVGNVDNISGLLQGDVSKDNIEYGIKSMGASTLGLKQIAVLAQTIISTPGYGKEQLAAEKARLASKGRLRNKCEDYIQSQLNTLLEYFDQK